MFNNEHPFNRRNLLLGAGLLLASASTSRAAVPVGRGGSLPPLRPGEWLKTPDFSLLAEDWKRAGLRPYRKGGARIERDSGSDIPEGKKALIHNYGHGGAGITLAWGSADAVKDMVLLELRDTLKKPAARARIVVVGAGVIGLATAAELKRWQPKLDITVMAETVDADGKPQLRKTTSWMAGGQFEPSGLWKEYHDPDKPEKMKLLHNLVRRSHRRIVQLRQQRKARDYGIVERKNYILATEDGSGFEKGMPADVIPPPRRGTLPFKPLARVEGKEYSTWVINPSILLPRLVADLTEAKVAFRQKTIASRAELVGLDADIIINCTGLGAGKMLEDRELKPVRGQLVVLKNPDELKYLFSGGCGREAAYLFCRQDDIVLGGSFQTCGTTDDLPDESYLAIRDRLKAIFEGKVETCQPANQTTSATPRCPSSEQFGRQAARVHRS